MPDWAQHVRPRLSSLHLSPTRENQIVEELSQYLDDRWRELISAGTPEDEAARLALAEFREGNLLARYMTPLRQANSPVPITPGAPKAHVLADLWQDLRYAARTLRKQRTLSLAAVLTLAVGLGANAAIFSVINAVLLRPLPYPNSERLVALYSRYLPSSGYGFRFFGLSGPEFADIRSRIDAFGHTAAYSFSNRNLTHGNGEAERVLTMAVTAQFFKVLGVKPVRGRTFTEEEAQEGPACAYRTRSGRIRARRQARAARWPLAPSWSSASSR